MKYSNHPQHQPLLKLFFWNPNVYYCYAEYLWVCWVEAADYVLMITLAVVIYRTIVKKEDVTPKSDPTFAKIVLVAFIIYPIVWTCIVGGVASISGFTRKGLSCAPSDAPPIMGIVQCFVALVIMIVLLTISLRRPLYTVVDEKEGGKEENGTEVYIWQVVRNLRNLSDSPQNRKAWLTIRFIIIMVLQSAPRLSYNAYYLSIIITPPNTSSPTAGQIQGYLIPPLCYWLNAMVVLWGNKSLHKWLQRNVWSYVSVNTTASEKSLNLEPRVNEI